MKYENVRINRQSCRKGNGWDVRENTEAANSVTWVSSAIITNCTMFVNQRLRWECVVQKERIYHAWVVCDLEELENAPSTNGMKQIAYNPLLKGYFYCVQTGDPVYEADLIYLTPQGMFTP